MASFGSSLDQQQRRLSIQASLVDVFVGFPLLARPYAIIADPNPSGAWSQESFGPHRQPIVEAVARQHREAAVQPRLGHENLSMAVSGGFSSKAPFCCVVVALGKTGAPQAKALAELGLGRPRLEHQHSFPKKCGRCSIMFLRVSLLCSVWMKSAPGVAELPLSTLKQGHMKNIVVLFLVSLETNPLEKGTYPRKAHTHIFPFLAVLNITFLAQGE